MSVAAAFNRLAPSYDELWTNSVAGRVQRDAVWRELAGLFHSGDRVLDLGCGTGEDAERLAACGAAVHAIDIAPGMVEATRRRARVSAEVLAVEDLGALHAPEPFDGAIANFGVLNCIEDLRPLALNLARLVRPRGRLAFCPMGRFCLWETIWYLLHARSRKTFRRLRRGAVETSLGFPVWYRSAAEISAAFAPHFRLASIRAIGLFTPPSFVKLPARLCNTLAAMDRGLAAWPLLRSMGDHQLLVFIRADR
jgi:ubiquinone/menaquinone biosynthesis C-methylase UbiE